MPLLRERSQPDSTMVIVLLDEGTKSYKIFQNTGQELGLLLYIIWFYSEKLDTILQMFSW